jgi:prepilin peptidase CpaA
MKVVYDLELARKMMIEPFLLAVAAFLLVYAALHDFAARTVPNWLSLFLLFLGFAVRLLDHTLLAGLAVFAATFAVLFVIWLLGAMGGGDVKLWAATAVLIQPSLRPELMFFLRVIFLGGALALLYLGLCLVISKPRASHAGGLMRRVLRVEAWRISRRAPLPYACAIAGSAILTLLPFSFQR